MNSIQQDRRKTAQRRITLAELKQKQIDRAVAAVTWLDHISEMIEENKLAFLNIGYGLAIFARIDNNLFTNIKHALSIPDGNNTALTWAMLMCCVGLIGLVRGNKTFTMHILLLLPFAILLGLATIYLLTNSAASGVTIFTYLLVLRSGFRYTWKKSRARA